MQFKNTVLISLVFMISAYYLKLIASTSSNFFPFSNLFPGNLIYHYVLLKLWWDPREREPKQNLSWN